jgi:hypothetical protein
MNNSNMIEVKFIGPTNTRGSRIQLKTYDFKHYNNDRPSVKYLNYDYSGDTSKQVEKYYKSMGLKCTGCNDRSDVYVYLFKWNIEAMAVIFGYEEQIK